MKALNIIKSIAVVIALLAILFVAGKMENQDLEMRCQSYSVCE